MAKTNLLVKKPKSLGKSKIKNNPIKKAKNIGSSKKALSLNNKQNKVSKRNRRPKVKEEKGVVYLSHIPHGFFEDQIEGYFNQFGKVTAVSLPRSKSGRPKGYAFIQFKHPDVAKIAAETMDNYLMFNRVLKAKCIPPEEQKPIQFQLAESARLNQETLADKTAKSIIQNRKLKNRTLKSEIEARKTAMLIWKEKRAKNALKKLGIDYDFEVQRDGVEAVFEERNKLREKKKEKALLENLQNSSTPQTASKTKKENDKAKQNTSKTPQIDVELSANSNTPVSKIIGTPKISKSKAFTPKLKQMNDLVMEVDENDAEINFKTPPNVLKKIIKGNKQSAKKTPKLKENSITETLDTPNNKISPDKTLSAKKPRHRKSLSVSQEVKTPITKTLDAPSVIISTDKTVSAKKPRHCKSLSVSQEVKTPITKTLDAHTDIISTDKSGSAKKPRHRKSLSVSQEVKTPNTPAQIDLSPSESTSSKKPKNKQLKRLSTAK